jgi:uncharacterized Zn-finger protein
MATMTKPPIDGRKRLGNVLFVNCPYCAKSGTFPLVNFGLREKHRIAFVSHFQNMPSIGHEEPIVCPHCGGKYKLRISIRKVRPPKKGRT